jgi:short subunit fatty acids transporter
MYVRKISLKITCLAIAAMGLLGTVSTLNRIPTSFAQSMTTAANNTQGMLTKFPFKPGIMVVPMTCSTPNDILKSLHLAASNTTVSSLFSTYLKNRMMMAGVPNKNMTASQLTQALNMEECFPSTFPQLKHFFGGEMLTP